MGYRVRLLDAAVRDLRKLDRGVARRILRRLDWLADNFDDLDPQPLTGDLAGLFKFRVGDYRAIYEPLRQEEVVIVHAVGHRRDVYRS